MVYEMQCASLPSRNLEMITELIRSCFFVSSFDKDHLQEYESAVVAQADKKYVAVLLLKKLDKDPQPVYKIECFCVLPSFRGKGLGTEMLSCLKANKNKIFQLEIDNANLNGKQNYEKLKLFYERNGFVEVPPQKKDAAYTTMQMIT